MSSTRSRERGIHPSETVPTSSTKAGSGEHDPWVQLKNKHYQAVRHAKDNSMFYAATIVEIFENKQGNATTGDVEISARNIFRYIPFIVIESRSGATGMAVGLEGNRVVRLRPQACQTERSA